MSLSAILPQPKFHEAEDQQELAAPDVTKALKTICPPPYGSRAAFIPKSQADYDDGGAFPEIHIAQYPLELGRKKSANTGGALAVQVDVDGNINYDAIALQGHDDQRIIHTSHKDLIPLRQRAGTGDIDLDRPSEEEVASTAQRTKAALEGIVSGKLAAQQPKSISTSKRNEPTYVRYTPANQMGESSNVTHKQRIIKMVDAQEDPMEPPKFKHKKIPARPPSPPPPVMHSPPRKLTTKDREDWIIPLSISNWKNPKGYTIPLDKRLASDGRSLQDVQISDRFAQFSEALNIAERTAREEIRQRNMMQQRLAQKEKAAKEEHLRELAQKAREERAGFVARRNERSPLPVRSSRPRSISRGRSMSRSPRRRFRSPSPSRSRTPSAERNRRRRSFSSEGEDETAARERDRLRMERRRDNERQMRMSRMGAERRMKALARDENRDISEKIALGVAKPSKTSDTFDQRLFNQSSGLDASFNEDNPYDRPLFAAQDAAARIYKPTLAANQDDEEEEVGASEMDRLSKEKRFEVLGRAPKGFRGTEGAPAREGPVEFVKDDAHDPFGVDQFLQDVQRGIKREGSVDEREEPAKRSRWDS